MESDLNLIQIDPPRRPLLLDRMFERASQSSGTAPPAAAPARAASPTRHPPVFPLPLPLDGSGAGGPSPLAGLFRMPELVPEILGHFERPAELAVLVRVCSDWAEIVRRKLYADVWVLPWEASPKTKLLALFRTLADRPDLCKLVKRLDIRFFPLDVAGEARYDLEDAVRRALTEMSSLERVVWTRDKSLTSPLFEAIVALPRGFAALPRVRSLELSGHSYRYFDPLLIGSMPALEELRIMMPDSTFRDALLPIVDALAQRPPPSGRHRGLDAPRGLRTLDIICRASPLIDDALLAALAPNLGALRRLTLIGCTRITARGVYAVLRAADALEELSMDATPHSGLHDLSGAPPLARLRTLALAFTGAGDRRKPLLPSTMPLLPPLPALTALDLTLSGERRDLPAPTLDFLLASVPFGQLERVALLNLVIGTDSLDTLLASPSLRELYVAVPHGRAVQRARGFDGSGLRVLHVNAPQTPYGVLSLNDLRDLAARATALDEVGQLNRVYEVHRRLDGDERVVELARWSRIRLPGYFQVWRA